LGQLLSSDQRDFEGGGAIAYAGSGLTLSRETVAPLIGAQSLKAVSTVNGLAFLWPLSGVDAYFTVPVGVRTFKVTLAVLAPAGRAMQLWVRRFHPGLATYDDVVTSFTGTGEIQWVSGEIDTLSDTPAVQFYLLDFASTIGSEYWIDGAFFSDSDGIPTGALEIAFASAPLAETPAWTDVTTDLQRVSFSRGRSSALSRWEAGQGTVLLENLQRQYEPFYGFPALSFDGNDLVTVGDFNDFSGNAAFSVECWVLPSLLGIGQVLVGKTDASDGWQLNLEATGAVRIARRAAAVTELAVSTTVLPPEQWSHVAATYDGSNLKIYVNGTLETTGASALALPNTALNLVIGARSDTTFHFTGDLADVRLWNVALTGVQIDDRMLSTLTGSETNLVGLWLLNEGTGTTANDLSPSNTDGTITGATWVTGKGVYPNILPRRRVRFRTANGTPVFEAFASGFYPTYESLDYATCSVPLADGFKVLGESLLRAAYDREVLADSPVFYYKMNETSGEVAFDSSGNGRHGRFYGAGIEFEQTWPESAHENSATYFPPLPDEGHLRAATTDITTPCSFEFNVLFPADGENHRIFSSSHMDIPNPPGSVIPMVLVITDPEGILDVYLSGGAAVVQEINSPRSVGSNGWHHIVVTVSADARTLTLYVDGEEVATETDAMAGPTSIPGQIPTVGLPYHPGPDGTSKWAGFMAGLAYYDSALSAGRVAAHYAAVRAGYGELTGERVENVLDQAEWPASRRDVETGQIQMASNYDAETQNALIAIKQAEETEGGHAFISRSGDLTFLDHYAALITHPRSMTSQATFGNEEGEHNPSSLVLAIDTDDTANVIRVTHQDGSVAEVRDETSVAKYGALAVDERSAALTAAEAKGQAEWELLRLKDPQAMRIRSMTFELFQSNVDQLCSLELMDRVTARWTPPGGGARIDQEALISKITHDINADPATWRMTIEMMPLGLATDQFWRWGTSAWEGADTRFGWGVGV
jgi:hypothetical protein